jgi:hypothetical protein
MSVRIIQVTDKHCGWEPGIVWARRHGLDPSRIKLPAVITVDDSRRTVSVDRYAVLDEDGRDVADFVENCIVTEPLVVQLEAPALPWPE